MKKASNSKDLSLSSTAPWILKPWRRLRLCLNNKTRGKTSQPRYNRPTNLMMTGWILRIPTQIVLPEEIEAKTSKILKA
jgi:hypothetical protein